MTSEHNDDDITINNVWHDRQSKNSDTVIQLNISDPTFNCNVHLMSDRVILNQVLYHLNIF
jgi:hypothetical protein